MRWPRFATILSFVPAAIGLMLVISPILMFAWNDTGARIIPHSSFKSGGLLGVIAKEEPVPASLKTVWSGRYQQYLGRDFGSRLTVFAKAVRLRNQILYSIFGMSAVPDVVIGQDKALYEADYIYEYCHRDLARFVPAATEWAGKLRQIQEYYGRIGKTFVYVISPSKVATYPEGLPADIDCPSAPADRAGRAAAYREILDRAGIRYVDGTVLMRKYRTAFPVPLFPRGGTHWGRIGAGLVVQAVVADLAKRDPAAGLTPFLLHFSYMDKPQGTDIDLASLLNLAFPDIRFLVGEVSLQSIAPDAPCHPPVIAEVGGSFLWGFNDILNRMACRPRIEDFYYYRTAFADYPDGNRHEVPQVDPALRRRELTGAADIVLLEENEQQLPRSPHAEALYDLLIEHRDTL